jgi:predicted alpha/beta superfamily hydrolase
MKQLVLLAVVLLLIFIPAQATEITLYEIPRTQVVPIENTATGGQYELYIKLPEGYNKESTYPVIYFTDAVWHIEILSAATSFLMENAILVGISWQKNINEGLKQEYGDHASRFSDYSFWKTANPNHPKLTFGLANSHLTFIRSHVFNYIETNFSVNPDNRSYFGYSLGGLFGAYTLVTQPDTFKNYILGSPSVQLLADNEIKPGADLNIINANVYISNGNLESERHEHIKAFVSSLNTKGNKNLSLTHAVIEGSHQTAFPLTGVSSITWLANLQKEKG